VRVSRGCETKTHATSLAPTRNNSPAAGRLSLQALHGFPEYGSGAAGVLEQDAEVVCGRPADFGGEVGAFLENGEHRECELGGVRRRRKDGGPTQRQARRALIALGSASTSEVMEWTRR
jgi:hypothetical protein